MAAMHYRVERTESSDTASPGTVARKIGRRVARNWYRPTLGLGNVGEDAVDVADVVAILDREGRVRFSQQVGDRHRSEALEHEITDDLLRLDKAAFEARWALGD